MAEPARHFPALKDFTWELTITNGPSVSVGKTVTVRGSLTRKVPPLHDTSEPFTFRQRNHVYKLTNFEMPWAKHVANRKVVFRSHRELSQVSLWWQIVF